VASNSNERCIAVKHLINL